GRARTIRAVAGTSMRDSTTDRNFGCVEHLPSHHENGDGPDLESTPVWLWPPAAQWRGQLGEGNVCPGRRWQLDSTDCDHLFGVATGSQSMRGRLCAPTFLRKHQQVAFWVSNGDLRVRIAGNSQRLPDRAEPIGRRLPIVDLDADVLHALFAGEALLNERHVDEPIAQVYRSVRPAAFLAQLELVLVKLRNLGWAVRLDHNLAHGRQLDLLASKEAAGRKVEGVPPRIVDAHLGGAPVLRIDSVLQVVPDTAERLVHAVDDEPEVVDAQPLVGLTAIGTVRADDFGFTLSNRQKGKVEGAVHHHKGAACRRIALLEPECLLIVVANLGGLLDHERDVSNLGHRAPPSVCQSRSSSPAPDSRVYPGWRTRSNSTCPNVASLRPRPR